MLCGVCQSVDPAQLAIETKSRGWPTSIVSSGGGFKHHDSIDDLFTAADEGCTLCQAIRTQIEWRAGHDPLDENIISGGPIWVGIDRGADGLAHRGPSSRFLVYQLQTVEVNGQPIPQMEPGVYNLRELQTVLDQGSSEPMVSYHTLAVFGSYVGPSGGSTADTGLLADRYGAHCSSGRTISERSDSDGCFALINHWKAHCYLRHPFCLTTWFQDKKKNFKPRRTIYVGPPDGSEEPYICEHTEKDASEPLIWTTLSHRWAGATDHITTTKNINARKERLSISELPKTFRDAIEITRKLDLMHVWIDCLCILQDDAADWAAEAAKMGDIYRHSFLTIAANCSKDNNEGILKARSLKADLARFHISSQDSTPAHSLHIRPPLQRWEQCLNTGSLESRGWILQESMLSPRTLHYCEEQLLWECRVWRSAEGDINAPGPILPAGLTRYESSPNKWAMSSILSEKATDGSDTDPQLHPSFKREDACYIKWYLLVVEYTARKITVGTDKFPALAGLARVFAERLRDEYCAGLFRHDLVRGLLWQAHSDEAANMAAVPHRAPSWSWASLEGGVEYDSMIFTEPEGKEIYRAEILDVSVTTNGMDTYASATSGTVTARGRWRGLGEYRNADLASDFGEDVNASVSFRNKCRNLQPLAAFFDTKASYFTVKEWYENLDVGYQASADNNLAEFGVLMLIGWETRSFFCRDYDFMDGIILQKVHHGPRREYRRIGWATMTDPLIDKNTLEGCTPWSIETVEII